MADRGLNVSALRLESLSYSFEKSSPIIDDLSFELGPGELFCLLGPSGCGKSTLLRLIGGYLSPDAGRVWIHGTEVTCEPPERRNAGMVFQNYGLFPHLSALENVAFSLRVRGAAAAYRRAKAHEMLDWVGLTDNERRRRPSHLSGGQQQRVALARALAFEPDLLMLDEPFANLDRLLRERLREGLQEIQRRVGIATILVTHDREEALALGDRLAVMHKGKLLQVGTPEDVYLRPRDTTVARFLGHRNLFKVQRIGANTLEIDGPVELPLPSGGARPGDHLLIWPERLRIHRTPQEGRLSVTLSHLRFAGAHRILSTRTENGALLEIEAKTGDFAKDEHLWIEIPPEGVMALPGGGDDQFAEELIP